MVVEVVMILIKISKINGKVEEIIIIIMISLNHMMTEIQHQINYLVIKEDNQD